MKRSDYNRLTNYVPSGKLPGDEKYKQEFKSSPQKNRAFPRATVALVLAVEILLAGLVSGCSGNGQQSSSAASSSDSQSVSEPALSSLGRAAGSSVPSSSAVSQSGNDYALPATQSAPSSAAPHSSIQSGVSPVSSESPVSQAANNFASQSAFQSVFGDQTQSAIDTTQRDNSGLDISLAEYDKIQDGMTYEAVKTIIGSDGKADWKSGVKGSDMYTEEYRWNGNNSSSYALLTFEGGKLDMKIQFGLE